jgi:hypothetical protein
MPSAVAVFDEGLLIVDGQPGAEISKLMLGVVGEFLVRAAARRDLAQRLTKLDTLGPDAKLDEAAAATEGRMIEFAKVRRVRIGPIARRRRLVFYLDDRRIKFKLDERQIDVRSVVELLEPVLHHRLEA